MRYVGETEKRCFDNTFEYSVSKTGPRDGNSMICESEFSFKIKWQSFRLIPGFFASAETKDGNQTLNGTGEAFRLSTAVNKATAEIIERIEMKRFTLEMKDQNISSNGFAAGSNIEMAVKNATEELIERHLLLVGWANLQGWTKYVPISPFSRIALWSLKRFGWKVKFYLIKSNSNHACLTCIGTHTEFGVTFESTYINLSKQENSYREKKLLLSLMRTIDMGRTKYTDSGLPHIGMPVDHLKYYSNPKNSGAFDFLNDPDSIPITITRADQIVTEIVSRPGAPFIVARASNENWSPLTWGRSSIFGVNPYPHPLA